MMIPVRCFNCGFVLGDKGERYQQLQRDGKTTDQALNELGIKKMCCRMNMLGAVDMMAQLLAYSTTAAPASGAPVVPESTLPPDDEVGNKVDEEDSPGNESGVDDEDRMEVE